MIDHMQRVKDGAFGTTQVNHDDPGTCENANSPVKTGVHVKTRISPLVFND